MKTAKNTVSGIQLIPDIPRLIWRNQFISQLVFSLIAALLIAACQRPAAEPLPGNPGTRPGDTTGTNPPRDSVNIPPKDSTGIPPRDSTGSKPDGPVNVFKRMKKSWSSSDFQEIQYDAANRPMQYVSQYVANQGTGYVQRWVHQFQYGPNQRLNRVNRPGIGYVQYYYEGDQVVRTEDYTTTNYLTKASTYQYSANNQLAQIDATLVNSKQQTRETYQYDDRGNLTTVSLFVLNSQSGTYNLETSIQYEDFDHQKTPENLLAVSPFLPNVTFFVNNYHTKIVRYKDGNKISRETFDYANNEQGYPTQQVRNGPGGTLTATYSY